MKYKIVLKTWARKTFLKKKNLIQKQGSYIGQLLGTVGGYLIISVITSKRHALSLVK